MPSNGSPFLRYDTQAGFDASGSWESLFLNRVSSNASRYSGASFDGQYIYLSPGGFGPVLPRRSSHAETATTQQLSAAVAPTQKSRGPPRLPA